MKILIVASGFTGAILPLAHHLSRKGVKVVCYNFVQRDDTAIESLDFDAPIGRFNRSPILVSKDNQLYKYLDNTVNFYLLPYWKRKLRMEKALVGKIIPLYNSFLIKKYIPQILSEHPDFVINLIHTRFDLEVAKALDCACIPFCMVYHEVLQGLLESKEIIPVVKESLKIEMPLVLHSDNTAQALITSCDDKTIKSRIHVINFGAFESYLSYGVGRVSQRLPNKYLLYLGHIHPYKGLKYLYEAVKILGDGFSFKIVVAGGGKDPIIKKMNKDQRFVVMNHFIDNAELVGLIRNCQAIVCPYIAASQSGLVQTGMVFNKPIIATKVGAFKEVVRDGENGYLCEPANARSLADTIVRFVNRDKPFSMSTVPDNLNWDIISDKYIDLFNNIHKER
jgi:glycosyltransferase involved in cell wall biosynthesis